MSILLHGVVLKERNMPVVADLVEREQPATRRLVLRAADSPSFGISFFSACCTKQKYPVPVIHRFRIDYAQHGLPSQRNQRNRMRRSCHPGRPQGTGIISVSVHTAGGKEKLMPDDGLSAARETSRAGALAALFGLNRRLPAYCSSLKATPAAARSTFTLSISSWKF